MSLKAFLKKGRLEAGCDEAGRGCLAGPVVAAAVILPEKFDLPWLNDSKKLTAKKRNQLRLAIEEQALTYGVAFVNNREIDEINILNASFVAMHRAIDQLSRTPEFLLIDGNRFLPHPKKFNYECIIKGDGKYASIAAASILAKTYRDEFMVKQHQEYPGYSWDSNKGYPTKKHREGIANLGITPLHRKSFTLTPKQTSIPFKP
jgi:ribonuclease HII